MVLQGPGEPPLKGGLCDVRNVLVGPTQLSESTLEGKEGCYFYTSIGRFSASDHILPLPNQGRLKKLELDETIPPLTTP